MALNAELAMSIEHKIHEVRYQSHHHHYHHVHQVLTHHHHHLHDHLSYNKKDNNNDQILTLTENHQLHNHRIELVQHMQSVNQSSLSENSPANLSVSPKMTPKTSSLVTPAATIAPILRKNDQQLAIRRNQHQVGMRLRQKSQIQFFLFAAFAYLLSPIDLIPEIIFGVFGILDDLLFLCLCMFCIAIILIYPVFRETRRALFDRLGLRRAGFLIAANSINDSGSKQISRDSRSSSCNKLL